jgi:hypothetical protein
VEEADPQLRPGARQLDRVEAMLVQRVCGRLQGHDALVPGGLRVGLVEAVDEAELLTQLLVGRVRREARVDELRPVRMRAGDGAPVGRAVVYDLGRLLERGELVAAEQLGVEPVEGVGPDDAAEADPCRIPVAEPEQPLAVPRRDKAESLGISARDPRPLDERVVIEDVDEQGAQLVGRTCDRVDEFLLADGRRDPEDLPRLNVRAVNGEIADALDELVHGRRS